MPIPSFKLRLLGVLLAATAAGCDDGKTNDEVCYVPGSTFGEGGWQRTKMPELPCLPRDDKQLILNPGCAEDFEVTAGPAQKTNANGEATCCYTRSYTSIANCVSGRPLWAGEEQRTAALTVQRGWGA